MTTKSTEDTMRKSKLLQCTLLRVGKVCDAAYKTCVKLSCGSVLQHPQSESAASCSDVQSTMSAERDILHGQDVCDDARR